MNDLPSSVANAVLRVIGGESIARAAPEAGTSIAELVEACELLSVSESETSTLTHEVSALCIPLAAPKDLRKLAEPKEKLAGIYFLFDSEELVYVGKSTTSTTRLSYHLKSKLFTHTVFVPCNEKVALVLESRYVHAFRPKYNLKPTGEPHSVLQQHQLTPELVSLRLGTAADRRIKAMELLRQGVGSKEVSKLACIPLNTITELRKLLPRTTRSSSKNVKPTVTAANSEA